MDLVRRIWQRFMALPVLTRASMFVGVIAVAMLIAVLQPRPPEAPAGVLGESSTHRLPTVAPRPSAPPPAADATAATAEARGGLKFKTTLDLRAMLARLNAAGPYKWTLREGHYRGEYLWTSVPPTAGVRIFSIPGPGQFLVDLKVSAPSPGAPVDYKSIENIVREKVLSEVQATDIQPSLAFD